MNIYEKKSHLITYKGGKCLDCGNFFPQCCYDFDHREPKNKSFTVSQKMGKPLAELMIEADKCDLVCANCHRIRTAGNPLISDKMKKGQKGRPAWNRGKKCPQISANMIGNKNGAGSKGKILSLEQRQKMSENFKIKGIAPSLEARKKGALISNMRTKEQRSEASKKAWETRRAS